MGKAWEKIETKITEPANEAPGRRKLNITKMKNNEAWFAHESQRFSNRKKENLSKIHLSKRRQN